MQMKKLSGRPPVNTRRSSTYEVIESVGELLTGEYIEILCSKREANAIRQSLYRHYPSVRTRVNRLEEDKFNVIIQHRDQQKGQSGRSLNVASDESNKVVNGCCRGSDGRG